MRKILLTLIVATGVMTVPLPQPMSAAPVQAEKIPWPTFKQTASKEAVPEAKAIQFLLRARGFYSSQPDGIFGPQTTAAVKKFQRSQGLKADGIVGAATFPKLIQTVKRGSRGDSVRAVQILLRDFLGHEAQYPYGNMKVDGVFGFKTESAVRDYQGESQVGGSKVVQVNGVVNTITWALIFHSKTYLLDA